MKRMILSLACAVLLVAAGFSFWVITSPVTALASTGKADCEGGGTVTCDVPGASCIGHDPDENTNGYCICTANGQQVLFKTCDNPNHRDPPLLD